MSCCHIKQLLKELDYCKHRMNVWGRSFDLPDIIYALRNHVKEFFPLNGVPQHIVDSLDLLEARINIAEEQLHLTCDTIIHEIEKELP